MCAHFSGWAGCRANASTTTCARLSLAARVTRWSGSTLPAPARPHGFPRHRLHASDAAREGRGRSGCPLPQERLLARAPLRRPGRARRAVRRLARPHRQPAHARERALPGLEWLAEERRALRPLPLIGEWHRRAAQGLVFGRSSRGNRGAKFTVGRYEVVAPGARSASVASPDMSRGLISAHDSSHGSLAGPFDAP